MFDPKAEYEKWLNTIDSADVKSVDELCRAQVENYSGFFNKLKFGTGGLRAKLGMGLDHMNIWTIGAASQGLANYLLEHFESPSVAIARDSRLCSELFSRRTAEILASSGIKVYYYESIQPTPVLSYTVRELNCSAGVVITASHNPKEYNGYKVYGSDGCQATIDLCNNVQKAIDAIDPFTVEPAISFDNAVTHGLISYVSEDVLDSFIKSTLRVSTRVDCSDLTVAYSPLNGTGLNLCKRIMKDIFVKDVHVVPQQERADGNFPTCPKPNPENADAMKLGLLLAKGSRCDILIATDPDCDRIGVAVDHRGEWKQLTGNELGLVLLDYLARRKSEYECDMSHKVACTSIVSGPMANDIALKYGFQLRRTLTGFKFIGEQIALLESEGRESDFLMGFEESCGYLSGTHVRDKCGIVSTMLACEAAAWWKQRGKDLFQVMQDLYFEYGYWIDRQINIQFDGPDAMAQMTNVMNAIRSEPPFDLGGKTIVEIVDYQSGIQMPVINDLPGDSRQTLPPSNVIRFNLEGGSYVIVRPSGTEPKIKIYEFVKGATNDESKYLEKRIVASLNSLLCS